MLGVDPEPSWRIAHVCARFGGHANDSTDPIVPG
jgi:hypothetical protein